MRANNVLPNAKLRTAREERSLSQGQVAELVADDVQRRNGRRPPIDADQVSRYERGLHRWPGRDYRLAFREVFGLTTDAELGFYSGRSGRRLEPAEPPSTLARRASCEPSRLPPGIDIVDRREFLFGLGAIGTEIAAGTSLGTGEVRQLRHALQSFRTLDNGIGGDRLHEGAAAHLRHVSRLLNTCRFRESTGKKLRAAFADLSVFTGWLSVDAGLRAEAWYYYNEGLTAARLAGDTEVEVHALAQMSGLAGPSGRPRDAVDLAREARRLAAHNGMPPRLVSLLYLREARGWSALQEVEAMRRALRAARRAFDQGPDEHDPAWISFFDRAELDGLEAICLDQLGEYDRAAVLTARTLEQLEPQYVRNRAIYTASYAVKLTRAGRPDEAATAGGQTLALLTEVSSSRTRDRLRDAHRQLIRRYGRLPAVREFDQQYRTLGVA